jgi:hypothetical protein
MEGGPVLGRVCAPSRFTKTGSQGNHDSHSAPKAGAEGLPASRIGRTGLHLSGGGAGSQSRGSGGAADHRPLLPRFGGGTSVRHGGGQGAKQTRDRAVGTGCAASEGRRIGKTVRNRHGCVKNQPSGLIFGGANEKFRKSAERNDGKWRLSLKANAYLIDSLAPWNPAWRKLPGPVRPCRASGRNGL